MSFSRQLTSLEVAVGDTLEPAPPLVMPDVSHDLSPAGALEQAVLPGVRKPPCLVSFSGGNDSSLVLAAATRVARREGLPDPIPATIRVPDAPDSHEPEWQEQVVAHLGLADWQRYEIAEELDLVGPVASAMVRRHGVLWPANSHFHFPLLKAARGGALLTGVGGDHLFAWGRRPVADLLVGRRVPHWRDPLRLAYDLTPWRLRALVEARRLPEIPPWIRPAPRREVVRILAHRQAREPRGWPAFLAEMAGSRRLRLSTASLDLLARDAGAVVAHPLLDPTLVAALAYAGGRFGAGERAVALPRFFGDLVLAPVRSRRTKARFDGLFIRAASRSFVDGWTGTGVPAEVDPEALASAWRSEGVSARSALLLQSAWLASDVGKSSTRSTVSASTAQSRGLTSS